MNVRDELVGLIAGGPTASAEARADAILARFPYMSADRSLYDYADSLRTQLNAANKKPEKEKMR